MRISREFRYNRARQAWPDGADARGLHGVLGADVGFSERVKEIREGFAPAFWVANVTEMFERLAYYAAFASLANYLHSSLGFPTEQTASLSGIFGGLVWFLAIIGGAVADRLGFRRALSAAYLILTCSYFLLGSIGSSWMGPVRHAMPLFWMVLVILMLPALGISMVKPAVVGTTARTSKENVRSIGYSIYYTLVNVGGAAGPLVASVAHRHVGVQSVFRIAALSVLVMFFVVLLFFKEPRSSSDEQNRSVAQTVRNLGTVLANPKFMLFLTIFSGYWIVYWQVYIGLPLYITGYINPHANVELILVTDAASVICLQIIISYLTRKMRSFRAITIGTVITSLAWLIVAFRPTIFGAVAALFVVALGEMTLSPRYYEYVSRLAPPGQQGTYMGFAFVPIGVGSLVGGWLMGHFLHHFGEIAHHPERAWWAMTGVGLVTALALWIYDRSVTPKDSAAILTK
ncbi:MAG TPA: MFS transporter [Candidatus Acidoferrales bacterium]|nr:MFS transporter [Candidatus Acidoferrales bacterium]